MKPQKIHNYLRQCEIIAENSHDSETKVGAMLINSISGAALSQGYNGFVRSAPDDKLPSKRPDKYEYVIHAEENLLMNCARHGISTDECFVVCTMSPCVLCMRLLWQAGIRKIYCLELYKDFEKILEMDDIKVVCKTIEAPSSKRVIYSLEYETVR